MANSTVNSDWVDVPQSNQASDSDWKDVSTEQPQQDSLLNRSADAIRGVGDKIGQFMQPAMNAAEPYFKSQEFSPASMIQNIPNILSKAAGKVGEMGAEALVQPNTRLFRGKPYDTGTINPTLAAGVGTVAAMAPDIAMTAVNPLSEWAIASRAVPEAAMGLGRRALGFSKAMLKTPFSRGQAQKAAQTALENDVIPWSGSPETALDNASNLANKSGQAIGTTLNKVPANLDGAMESLGKARAEISQGFSGGIFQKAHSLIDDVESNIRELAQKTKSSYGVEPILGKSVNANELNKIKTRLGRSINYLADLASQSDNKTVVNNLANSIRDSVKAVLPPEEYADFIKNQKLFNTAELMKKGLNNEVAGQQGNRMFSPYSVIPAAGEIAAGNPVKAAATLGLTEGILRRSAGTTARGLTEGYRAAPAAVEIGSKAATKGWNQTKEERLKELQRKRDNGTLGN